MSAEDNSQRGKPGPELKAPSWELSPIDENTLFDWLGIVQGTVLYDLPSKPTTIDDLLRQVANLDTTSFQGIRTTNYDDVQEVLQAAGEGVLRHPQALAHIRERFEAFDAHRDRSGKSDPHNADRIRKGLRALDLLGISERFVVGQNMRDFYIHLKRTYGDVPPALPARKAEPNLQAEPTPSAPHPKAAQPAVGPLDPIKAQEDQHQQRADRIKFRRQQALDRIRNAEYPGFAPELVQAEGPFPLPYPYIPHVPPETVYPQNIDGVAVIPRDTAASIKELGSGVTGYSLLVIVAKLGPPVVLKTAKLESHAIHDLNQEIRALTNFRKLGIKFVPRIEGELDITHGHGFFMEYIQGETIDQLRDRTSSLPLDGVTKMDNSNWEMAYMCMQFLQALAQIHGTRTIHGDLGDLEDKPAHLIWARMTQPDGTIRKQLKLIDFGNAVFPDSTGNVSGRAYVHDVATAFKIILKYGFRLPVEGTNTFVGPGWQKTIQATGNQDLIKIAAQIWQYKDAQAFLADMMPIFERMM